MTTQETRNTLKFTQMCRYFRANRCHLGNECNFAHTPEELRKAPSLVGTKLCFQFSSKGQCSKGAACNFAHGKEELQSMPVEARNPVGRRGGRDPMKVKATKEVKAVEVQGPRDACDAISKMHLLQMKMNQLESLSMRLAVASQVAWHARIAKSEAWHRRHFPAVLAWMNQKVKCAAHSCLTEVRHFGFDLV